MEAQQLQKLLRYFPDDGVDFSYFKDRYALALLSYVVGEGRGMRDLKSSRYAGLLDKPPVKELARGLPDGRITREALNGIAPKDPREFFLTFGSYGYGDDNRACQTSRAGMNFVVQVNFPDAHDREMIRMLSPGDTEYSLDRYSDHPVSYRRRTMAWVRIDIDPEEREALIEEVQSDWIRIAQSRRAMAQRLLDEENGVEEFASYMEGAQCAPRDFLYYADRVLRPYERIWSEATLAAALWILVEIIGVRRIFYHTHTSGEVIKEADGAPRSLYTDLPRKFCFQEVRQSPSFLGDVRMRQSMAAVAALGTAAKREADPRRPEGTDGSHRLVRVPFYLLDLN